LANIGVVTGGDFGDNELCYDYTMEKCAHTVDSKPLGACDKIPMVQPTCNSTCATNKSIDYASDKH
jgi:cathepsin B